MSESMQVTPSATAGAQQSKLSSLNSTSNSAPGEDTEGFTAVFASYIETEPGVTEQQMNENLTQLLSELLPQNMPEDGNSLPQADDAAMWQALMLLQPAENTLSNSASNQLQSISLLDGQRRSALSPAMLNQDYFNNLGMQIKEPGTSIPAGLAANNISAQLAAAHFIPENRETLLLNMNEQLLPVQSTNSTVSQGLAAVGLGTATQAATTQTQMAPLNLGQNAWETSLGSRLQMMVGQNVQTAEIRLDPPELGALDIKIKVTNDIASVNITSPHSQVREALETAVPKLREMFAENGLSLGDVNVRQESFAQQQNSNEQETGSGTAALDSDFGDEPVAVTRKIVSDGLLDIYA
ncbi:MAG: flagellar hook-length control protein FliK [Gammaproteobacteria bacterium]|nr:flagellar hook-length control protein FliK [Gammaproteobacteria bacterium]